MARRASSKTIPQPAPSPEETAPRSIAERLDSWMNTITGMGGSADKLTAGFVQATRHLWQDAETLETLYFEDDLIRKYVNKIVEAALRESFEIHLAPSLDATATGATSDTDGDEVKRRCMAIKRRFRELLAEEQMEQADKLGRLHGGSAVFIGADGSDPSTPLDASNVGKIRRLAVYERDELQPLTWYDDPLTDDYGQVETWRLVPMGVKSRKAIKAAPVIHTTRLLKFEGLTPTRRERQKQNGWSPSVVVNAIEQVRDGQQNWRSIGLILNQAHQAVFKIQDLIAMIANGEEEELQKRMRVANMARSAARAVCIDAEKEEFEYHSASLGGLDVIAIQIWQRIAACFDMPVTVLMGTSPAGMNATGDSDMRQWYDSIKAHREQILGPKLERLVRLVAAELGDASPSEWTITWPSLWQMSPVEEATYRKTIADTDVAYVQAGVATPQEVANTRFGGGSYSADAIKVEADLRDLGEADPDDGEEAYGETKSKATTTQSTPAVSITLAPTDIAKIVTVNEARSSQGLDALTLEDGTPDPDGKLTLAAFAALQEAKQTAAGATVGQAEGAAQVTEAMPVAA